MAVITLRRQFHGALGGACAGSRLVYAVGDIHGCYDLFLRLLQEIRRDAAERDAKTTPILVLCGDYVDRGPASSKVLTALTWLSRSNAVETRLLEGNHEAMLRLFLEDPVENQAWLSFGGRETLKSYGVDGPETTDSIDALTVLRNRLLDAMPASHLALLQSLQTMVRAGDFTFVHAGVKPGVPLDKQARDDLLWIREEFLNHPGPASSIIVHGHTWLNDQPAILPHRIGIDTGAYETGVLTALRIENGSLEFIQAVDADAIDDQDATRTPASLSDQSVALLTQVY